VPVRRLTSRREIEAFLSAAEG